MATDLREEIYENQTRSSLAFWVASTVCFLWLVLGVFLLSRRFAGAFSKPLEIRNLLACAGVMLVTAWAIRRAWSSDAISAAWLLPSIAILLTAISISLPHTARSGLLVFWVGLIFVELLSLLLLLIPGWQATRTHVEQTHVKQAATAPPKQTAIENSKAATSQLEQTLNANLGLDPSVDKEEEEDETPALDPEISQQLTRTRTSSGSEMLAGKIQVAFSKGEKSARAHVAFSPPFPSVPEVYIEPLGGEIEFESQPAKAFRHGVRIDVALSEAPQNDVSVWLELYAVSEA